MRPVVHVLLTSILLANTALLASEYFGEFKDELKGSFVISEPRPLFKLETEFRFLDPNGLFWTVPAAELVDGASIPAAFWSIIGGPFSGKYIRASVIHDYFCDEKSRTEHDTHRNFYYGMRASGVAKWKAKFMYWTVATFGPKWKLESRMVRNLKCSEDSGSMVCVETPQIVVRLISSPAFDLDDPEILAVALSKASAVARTLKSTEGEVLDISLQGQVSATLDDIAASSENYRTIFQNRSYLERPSELGVLSTWDGTSLEGLSPWEGETLPTYEGAAYLRGEGPAQLDSMQEFRLKLEGIKLLEQQLRLKVLESDMQEIQ